MGLTLDQIRLQLNIPQSTSDAEVIRIAQENNIVIDFSGSLSQSRTDVKIGSDVSLFGQQNTPAYQQSSSASIFGDNGSQTSSNFGLSTPALTPPTVGLSVKPITFNFNKFNNLFSSAISQGNENYNKIHDAIAQISENNTIVDQSKVVSVEYGENGEIIQNLEDGTKNVVHIDPEKLPNQGKNGKYSKIEYVDGQVLHYDKDGNLVPSETRPAIFGERGYVKSGNSIQEDLQQKVGKKYQELTQVRAEQEEITVQKEQAQNNKNELQAQLEAMDADNPQRKEIEKQIKAIEKQIKNLDKKEKDLAKKEEELTKKVFANYVASLIKECDGDSEKLKAKIREVASNSDHLSKDASQLFAIISQVHDKWGNGEITQDDLREMYSSLMEHSDPEVSTQVVQDGAIEATRGNGKKAATRAAAIADASENNGLGEVFSQTFVENAHNVQDSEVAEVLAEKAITMSEDPSNTAQSLSQAVTNPPEGTVISDEVKAGFATGTDSVAATTGDTEIMQAAQDIITSMESAEAQVEADKRSTEIYENADDSIKEQHSAVVGNNLANYHEDAQLAVDENQREHDTNDAYNKAAAGNLHLTATQNQQTLVQRTLASGNEEAINTVAENAYNYDLSNRDDIIRMIQEQGTTKSLEILENARKAYEEQAADSKAMNDAQKAELERKQQEQAQKQKEAQAQAETEKAKTSSNTQAKTKPISAATAVKSIVKSNGISKAVSSDTFREFKAKEKTEFINTLSQSDKKDAIKSMVENAQGFELDSLMFSGLKNDILKYLVSHPTTQNKEKLKYLQRYLSAGDKAMVQQMEQEILPKDQQVQNTAEADNADNKDKDKLKNPFKFGFISRN